MAKGTYTLVGNLGADPELRESAQGRSYVRFRVAENDSWRDEQSGTWVTGSSSWWDVTCWDELADNVLASLRRGSRVVVSGVFDQREYTVGEGEKRRSTTLKARSVALDLRRGPARQAVRDRPEGAARTERVDAATGVLAPGPWDVPPPTGQPAPVPAPRERSSDLPAFDSRPLVVHDDPGADPLDDDAAPHGDGDGADEAAGLHEELLERSA